MSIPGAASPLFLTSAADDAAFKIDRSLRFNSGDSAYLSRTPSSEGNRKKWTWSGWVKRSELGRVQNIFRVVGALSDTTVFQIRFMANDAIGVVNYSYFPLISNAVFRDVGAWLHLVVALDVDQASNSNKLRFYINGSELTSWSTDNRSALGTNAQGVNQASVAHTIGGQGTSEYFSGYLAEIHFVDGQALAPTDFGEYDNNNVWQAKQFTGTHNLSGRNYTGEGSTSGSFYTSAGGAASKMFDGSASTGAFSQTGTATFTFGGSTITASSSLKVRAFKGDASGANVLVNGTDISSLLNAQSGGGYSTVDITSTLGGAPINLSNVSMVNAGGGSGNIAQIFVDNVELVDVVSGNGFYLKFANNSSNAALGTDSSGDSNTFTVNNLVVNVEGAETSAISSISGNTLTFTDSTDLDKFSAGDIIQEVPDGPRSGYTSQTPTNPENAVDGDINTHTIFSSNSGSSADWYEWTLPYARSYTTLQVVMSGSAASGNDVYIGASNGTVSQATNQFESSLTSTATAYTLTNMPNPVKSFSLFLAGGNYSPTFKLHGLIIDGSYVKTVTAASVNVANNQIVSEAGGDWATGRTAVKPAIEGDNMLDTPTNYTAGSGNNGGNYATLNPLESALTGINNGNLNSGSSGSAGWKICTSTLAVSSGKYYWEGFTDTTATSSQGWQWGFCNVTPSSLTDPYGTGKWSYQAGVHYSQSSSGSNASVTAVANDLLAYALDMDAGTCKLYVNNSLVHTFTGISGTVTPFVGSYNSPTVTVNFGQRPFAYTPPTGHVSLCTQNLPTPTIEDGSTAFDVDLYTGTGSTHERSEFSFSPDFVWIKQRNTTRNNLLFDTVRGANKFAVSNSTGVPGTGSGMVTSFDSDGFTLGNSADVNQSNGTFVAWCWDGGTSTVSNTDGSITSNVRANASAGFSIVSWTGTGATGSIGHGLNSKPQLVITKNLAATASWVVDAIGVVSSGTDYLLLNTTQAASSGGSTADNSVVNILQYADRNGSGNAMLAYCFTSVDQYSRIGVYTGNGSTDGPFVYTGFRPKFIIIKGASSGGSNYNWAFVDTERSIGNVANHTLAANLGNGESYFGNGANAFGPNNKLDILSNGFKPRESATFHNTNNVTYLYIAFAEHPFKAARAR